MDKLQIMSSVRPDALESPFRTVSIKPFRAFLNRYAGWMSAVVERTLTVRQSLAVTWCVISFVLMLVFSGSSILVLCIMAVHFLTSLIVARKQLR